EKKYDDYFALLETYDDKYTDLKSDYNRAVDRNNEDDIDDFTNDLEDLWDDLDKLLTKAEDLVDDIKKAKDTKYDNLEDNAKDLVDDIEKSMDRIDRLLNPTDNLDFFSADYQAPTQSQPSTTDAGTVVLNSLPAEALANIGPISQPEEPANNTLLWLLIGIVIVIAVIIFLVVLLLRV
ncbi:MAG: hypothetical protein ABIH82_03255, partial [Candidatus Woesearchaeota archaeon]